MKQNIKIANEIIKIAKMLVAEVDSPSVYVGTYAKYNNGDLTGQWVDLTNFSSYEEFLEYCAELHSDESDPEFMFQDYECFPQKYYGESGLNSELWDYIDYIQSYDKDMIDAILEEGYELKDADDFIFYSNCNNKGDFARAYIDEMGGIENLGRSTLESYFDYDHYGRELSWDVTLIQYHGGYLVNYN